MSNRAAAPPRPRVRRRPHRAAAALAAAVLLPLLPVTASPAHAADPTPAPAPPAPTAPAGPAADNSFRWSVQPVSQPGGPGRSYLVHDLAPGQTLDDAVRISNYTDRPMTFTVYGTDAFTTTDGSFSLLPADRKPVDAGTWIATARSSVTVRPGEFADVPVTVTVPADAEPGDHAAGVIASVATTQTDASGRLVQVDRRIAARAYFRVAGPVHAGLSVDDIHIAYDNPGNPFPGATATVTYRVRNTGNTRLAANTDTTISGPFDWKLGGPRRHNATELLPGAEITVTERFDGVFPAGKLTATVTARAGQAPQGAPVPVLSTTRTAGVWAVPWAVVGGIAAVMAAAALVLWLRRRGSARETPAGGGEGSGGTGSPGTPGPPGGTGNGDGGDDGGGDGKDVAETPDATDPAETADTHRNTRRRATATP